MHTMQLFNKGESVEFLSFQINKKKSKRKKLLKRLREFRIFHQKVLHGVWKFQNRSRDIKNLEAKNLTLDEKNELQACEQGVITLNSILIDKDYEKLISSHEKEITRIGTKIKKLESRLRHISLANHTNNCPNLFWKQFSI